MKDLRLNESVALPRAEYEALRDVAQAVLWANERASKINLPGVHGYLIDGHTWELIQSHLASITEEYDGIAVAGEAA